MLVHPNMFTRFEKQNKNKITTTKTKKKKTHIQNPFQSLFLAKPVASLNADQNYSQINYTHPFP